MVLAFSYFLFFGKKANAFFCGLAAPFLFASLKEKERRDGGTGASPLRPHSESGMLKAEC